MQGAYAINFYKNRTQLQWVVYDATYMVDTYNLKQ